MSNADPEVLRFFLAFLRRLTVYDTRIVQHIFGAIQEYGGFERSDWLG